MKSKEFKIGRAIVAKLEGGEDILDSVMKLVKEHKVKSGLVNVIGGCKKFTIGYFNIDTKEYQIKTFETPVEMTTCMGSIAQKDGEPIIHLHITLGNADYSIIGGHLSQPSIISVTGEVLIYEFKPAIERINDPEWDLSLLDL